MKKLKLLINVFLLAAFVQSAVFAESYLNSIEHHKAILRQAERAIDENTNNPQHSVWDSVYHLSAPSGAFGMTFGFVQYNDGYNIFYQHNPFSDSPSKMYFGHSQSNDMIQWAHVPVALASSDSYDETALCGATALVNNGLLYLIYSGEKKDGADSVRTINAALSNDGESFIKHAKNPIISSTTDADSGKDFSTPYVWKHEDSFYLMVSSFNDSTDEPEILLYKSSDLLDWGLLNIIQSADNPVKNWEFPSYLTIGNTSGIVFSFKEEVKSKKNSEIIYKTGFVPGKIDYSTGKFIQTGDFQLLDNGFDYFAPQVRILNDGRVVLFGAFVSESQPENSSKNGIAALPRILYEKNGKIAASVPKEFVSMREQKLSFKNFTVSHPITLKGFKGDVYEIETMVDMRLAKSFSLKLRTSKNEQTVITYDKVKKLLTLNREKSGAGLGGTRSVTLPLENHCLKLHIFVDKSSLEVFANDGLSVMSARIYPAPDSTGINMSALGSAKIKYFNFYKLNIVQ